jgi:Acetyltransferase (GNAT) domain
MISGDKVVLRPVRERDLTTFIDAHTEISNRGEFFPLGVQSESVLRRTYAETGFWERDEGTLLIWNRDDVMVGHIEFFRPVNYWDAYELSYQLYGQEHASQGYTTEAVRLLVDYLFATKKVNRISLSGLSPLVEEAAMTTTVGTGSREARAAPPVPPTTARPRLEQAERRRQLPRALTTEHFTLQTTRSELRRLRAASGRGEGSSAHQESKVRSPVPPVGTW